MAQEQLKIKLCSKCKTEKFITEFTLDKKYKDGYYCWCKDCSYNYRLSWAHKNKEKVRLIKTLSLHRKLNISKDQYLELIELQNNSCKICKKTASDQGKNLAIDHCHKTNKVRGLLCDKCNRGLGYFNDNLDSLQNAISYLKENK